MVADAGADVEHDRRGPRDACLGAGRQHLVQVLLAVGQAGEDGRHEHAGADPGVGEAPQDLQPLTPRRRPGLDDAAHVLVERAHAHGDRERGPVVQPQEGVEVAQDHGRLRQDRERVPEIRQRLDHAARQPVAPFAVLVGVGGRAHGHRLPVPARRRELAAQHLDDVRLDDDLRGEVVADPQVQVAVERAGEAVVAAMRAPAVRVHSPAEGDPAQLRHPVQSRLAGVFEVLRVSHVCAEYRTYVRVMSSAGRRR